MKRKLMPSCRRLQVLLLGFVAAGGLTSCSTLGGPEPPEVTLVDLRVEDMTVLETTLSVVIRVSNPNPDPMELDGAAFKLRLNGNKVGSGMTPEALTIPRFESRTLPVTFHLSNAAAIFKLRTIIEARAFDWGLSGKLYAVTPLGRRTLRVEREGHLDLEKELGGQSDPTAGYE